MIHKRFLTPFRAFIYASISDGVVTLATVNVGHNEDTNVFPPLIARE